MNSDGCLKTLRNNKGNQYIYPSRTNNNNIKN